MITINWILLLAYSPFWLLGFAVYLFIFWFLPYSGTLNTRDKKKYLKNVFWTHFWIMLVLGLIIWFVWGICFFASNPEEKSKSIITITQPQ